MDLWWYGYSNDLGLWIFLAYPIGAAITYAVGSMILHEKKPKPRSTDPSAIQYWTRRGVGPREGYIDLVTGIGYDVKTNAPLHVTWNGLAREWLEQ